MRVKEHYEKHLADFYSWMLGDLEPKSTEFQNLLSSNGVEPKTTKNAIDLGAGNGIQSIALKRLGFEVVAVDFNEQLLKELKANPNAKGVKTKLLDITQVRELESLKPELIICCGDTITHLDSKERIEKLISDCTKILTDNGHLILTFRNYTSELSDQQRFIPVKSTNDRILTCILEYEPEKVKVTDLLYEKSNGQWNQKVSSYQKVRIEPKEVVQILEENGMSIKLNQPINRMETIIANKNGLQHGI
ncbi:class I SAM-dependent methyltransferase [Flavobacteriaceae bacterium TP-CH-4]|uniref:Class I SAM-dependent methyltransferase n=1 Tax=Pelagihabitans pacificus TaxID=2696054 RepID=A0A967E8F8_9FLAO|nr:class I SAM-dependent methyltransferase [Pelagihabitans pacificus]NHF61620.1 class I SAM-dependent methyltransferase [Pelagihabitans pacificus]